MAKEQSGQPNRGVPGVSRRHVLAGAGGTVLLPLLDRVQAAEASVDLAQAAIPSSSRLSEVSDLEALLRPTVPTGSKDGASGMWEVWETGPEPHWIDLTWAEPVTTDRVEIYWGGNTPPRTARLLYWDKDRFVPVVAPAALGREPDRFNIHSFAPVRTDRLRLEIEGEARKAVGVRRWRVPNAGPVPSLPPAVEAGVDRTVVMGGATYLAARAGWLRRGPGDDLRWSKVSGPGEVSFADLTAAETTARFSEIGDYTLRLTGTAAGRVASDELRVRVVPPPPAKRLDVVYTTPYALTSPFWRARARSLIVNWIPHCIAYCERTDLPTGQGGIDNFVEAAKALRGEPHGPHLGYVFSNAWVHQTVESICLALMVDSEGDEGMLAAQAQMRATLERWIPIILAAQEPDGYLQTAYTLADRAKWAERWSPRNRADHEGYVAGYFIESAINHYTLTGGRDRRLYDAAKKLSDCWVANIGPDKKPWYDGHQQMEQALVRFGRFVNDVEGGGRGDAYVALARFLTDQRRGGARYDQSHLPAVKQYEAVGHAVRAVYFYSGMADIAAETGDVDYQSAVASLWDNMVNRKYYVTGGVGSGDTAEGFGADYGMRHDAYCESCSSCGLVFFQYKMNLAYHDARYADLYEETMYNALLGGVDLEGKSFCYTNPLAGTERAKWHVCPCCVGNIPRTLLMMPTWAYAKQADALYLNLFVGSRINVGKVAGTEVEMVQDTDYPWAGAVAVTVNPARKARFALYVRVPDRATSTLYSASPEISGLSALTVNGKPVTPANRNGYAVIEREWKRGDKVTFELPLAVQRVTARAEVEATRGQVALRYGPLVYSVETADQPSIAGPIGAAPLSAVWRGDLLGGVMAIEGTWRDGNTLRAVPYYARMNRTGEPVREFPTADGGMPQVEEAERKARAQASKVWIGV
ncbi:Tat pathway signal protein [Niveispirillum cyanobacteriorum]|uniref:Tat pathway signal protein n=1 Tax=Niveispirillum cyanobacteriorum TaxID=1612173 RepID=A0A2K9NCF9_9PROT|nr:Tat pathway signal protein [Niveispirillum cyanobacteriorum]GGE52376.1 hypothetical protein GCM10011317_08250 [Niveispirillum cyanobacteriorum]